MRKQVILALAWSTFQSFSTKILSLVLFVVLARILAPTELGVASAVILLLAFLTVISDQGFSDAVVQRQDLISPHFNSLLAISMLVSVMASVVVFGFSEYLAELSGAPESSDLIRASVLFAPVSLLATFQIALRRRVMDYAGLARASVLANIVAASCGVIAAIAGLGSASLVIHFCTIPIVSLIVLWPGTVSALRTGFDFSAVKSVFSFSFFVFISKLIDFFSLRVLDFLVVSKFGVAILGLYSVGSKIYLTVLQLLAFALIDVALSLFSRIKGSASDLSRSYLNFLFFSGITTFPLFCILCIASRDLTLVLFGFQWAESGSVAEALCLLGAIQSIQFFNGPLLLSRGKSWCVLVINIAKVLSAIVALTMFDLSDVSDVAKVYVCSQLLVTPLNFFLTIKYSDVAVRDIFSSAGFSLSLGLVLVFVIGLILGKYFGGANVYWRLSVGIMSFSVIFYGSVFVFYRSRIGEEICNFREFMKNRRLT